MEDFLTCTKCGNNEFLQLMRLQKIPAVMSPTGQEGLVPAPGSLKCAECGSDIASQFEEKKKEEESKIILANK